VPIHAAQDFQGAAVVSLKGECDAYDEPVLTTLVRERIAEPQPVIIDFSHASFVDSAVLGSLLAVLREAEDAGVPLVLYLPEQSGSEIHRVFSISGLDQILPVRRSWREATSAAQENAALVPGRREAEEAELLATFDALYAAATQTRDAEAAMRLFAQDADITMWGSDEPDLAIGTAEVGALVDSIAASESPIAFRWSSRRVHLETDVAWVNAVGEFALDVPGGGGRTTPYRVTAIFVRRDRRWLWHTHSGSEPNAA
jgi:anti-sigma B factor antagonist